MIDLQKNKEEFLTLCKENIHREGIDRLLGWLEDSDFFTAPASTRYHLCVDGGLCQHSLNVYHRMLDFCDKFVSKVEVEGKTVYNGSSEDDEGAFTLESIVLVALLHDICKANCYVRDFKNVKRDGKWCQESYWRWEEQFVWTDHGGKSVYMIQQFMRIYIDEAQAIAFHMGAAGDPLSSVKDGRYTAIYDKSLFAYVLHAADEWVTFVDEARG